MLLTLLSSIVRIPGRTFYNLRVWKCVDRRFLYSMKLSSPWALRILRREMLGQETVREVICQKEKLD